MTKMRFLCGPHRLRLSENPSYAEYQMQRLLDIGAQHYEVAAWQEALPYIGAAYEIADILVNHAPTNTSFFKTLATTSQLLAMTFEQLGYTSTGEEVRNTCASRLRRQPGNSELLIPLENYRGRNSTELSIEAITQ